MHDSVTRRLLLAGIAAGLLFFLVASIEALIRPGFSLSRHAISMLSLGERGWLMVATFIVSGALVVLAAAGLRRAGGGIAGPLLVGVYGLGLIAAGIFPAPVGQGFPPGTPDDMQPVMDLTATLHSIAFMLAFGSLIMAALVFAVRFVRQRAGGWALFSAACGIAMPVLIAMGMASVFATGIAFYLAAMLAWVWLGAVALRHSSGLALPAGLTA